MTIHVSAFPSQAIATSRTDGGSEILRFASADRFEEVDIYLTYLSSADLRKVAKLCLLTARRLDTAERAAKATAAGLLSWPAGEDTL